MAAEIKAKFGIEPELIAGSGGIFDVKVDGKLIFSKKEAGRFPESAEVLDAIT
ncbi:MAG: SelT/SelW/SelH family protein [candidate division Zixibacteria bacterium]|nr:SelT/SelW/SelH family protein [candidate division Zixibacteria bacterium]